MDVTQEVIKAAEDRASALVSGDAERLRGLLHEQFRVDHAHRSNL